MSPDYKAILADALEIYSELVRKREAIQADLQKQSEFIEATMNMLSDEDRVTFGAVFDEAAKNIMIQSAGLKDAIMKVLGQESKGEYLTVTQVRDRLQASGFDFRQYRSNPLASVSTTLRRMPPEEVQTMKIGDVAGYRINPSAKAKAVRQSKVGAGRLGPSKLPQ